MACECLTVLPVLIGFVCSSASLVAGEHEEQRALEAIAKAGGYVGGISSSTARHLQITYATKDIKAVAEHVQHVKHIESITCIGEHDITDELLKVLLSAAPGLKRLQIAGFGDDGLKIISKAKNLEYLRTGSFKFTDAGLKHLAELENLRELHLAVAQFTDKGFEHLASLRKLETISYVFVDDESLKGIAKIASLKTLDLTNYLNALTAKKSTEPGIIDGGRGVDSRITNQGWKALSEMKNLKRLSLFMRPISDEGAKYLAGLEGLEYLDLNETKISDEALKHVAKLKNLKHLRLEKTRVGDAGLAHLKLLENLSTLDLCNTKVTNHGILQLVGMKALRNLSIGATAVTSDGRAQFRRQNDRVLISEFAGLPNLRP